jgi:hypothetical protein
MKKMDSPFVRLMDSSFVRFMIALTVILVTLYLTMFVPNVSSDWDAVFLVVVGYYFKDRPSEDAFVAATALSPNFTTDDAAVKWEMLTQFLLALILLVGTFFAFAYPDYRPSVSGAWVGAAVLAVGFYFKETQAGGLEARHDRFRAVLAITVTLLTAPLFVIAVRHPQLVNEGPITNEGPKTIVRLPLQWIGVVFIVVTFYFKEKSSGTSTPPASTPPASVPA